MQSKEAHKRVINVLYRIQIEAKKVETKKLLNNKYSDKLDIEQTNIDKYFILKQSNIERINELKNKLKKNKKKSGIFNTIYENNKQRISIVNESILYSSFDKYIMTVSMINNEVFKNLYLKVIFYDPEKIPNEEDICDVFSFWYILKNLKPLGGDSVPKPGLFINVTDKDNKFDPINSMIIRNIKSYFKYLNTKKSISESDIFSSDFYKAYEYYTMFAKIKIFKVAEKLMKEMKMNNKECLTFLKMISSINQNNGSYMFQIAAK